MRTNDFDLSAATTRIAIGAFVLFMLTGCMACLGHQLQEFGEGPLTSDSTVSQFQPQTFIPPE